MTVAITAMKPAVAIRAPVSNLNVTAAAASQNTGPVTATMTVETTVTRLTPIVPTRVRTACTRAYHFTANPLCASVAQDVIVFCD